jgi:6-phosphofructokinase 2
MKTENIVTLTMNPAIDISSTVRHVMSTHKIRCLKTRRDPGGGGINVARALKRFGEEPLAIFPVGGPSGLMLERLVAAEDVRHQSFNTNHECRANFTVNELDTGEQYRFVLPGPTLGEEEWNAGLGLMTAACPTGYAIASGSLPRGVPHDFYARLAHNLKKLGGARLVLDTSGPPLKQALDVGCYLVKPSLSEFADFMGVANPDQNSCVEAARQIVTSGNADIVALTLGADGAILVSRDLALQALPPPVKVMGTVGAGDSFLGVLVLNLARRQSLIDAFRRAIAAGSAALASAGTGLCSPELVEELTPQVKVNILNGEG